MFFKTLVSVFVAQQQVILHGLNNSRFIVFHSFCGSGIQENWGDEHFQFAQDSGNSQDMGFLVLKPEKFLANQDELTTLGLLGGCRQMSVGSTASDGFTMAKGSINSAKRVH